MSAKLTEAQKEFLHELAFENCAPEEPWKRRDYWEPMFPLSVIDALAKKGFIETRGDRKDESFAYRFTPAGRAALQKHNEPASLRGGER